FHQRCPRVLQEERKFRRRKTTKTFRDVARRRCTRAAYLIAVLEVANAGHGLRKGTRRASVDYMKIPGTSTRPVRERPEYCGNPGNCFPRLRVVTSRTLRSRRAPCSGVSKHPAPKAASTLQRSLQAPCANCGYRLTTNIASV